MGFENNTRSGELPDQVGPSCIIREFVHSLAMYNCQIMGQQHEQEFATTATQMHQQQHRQLQALRAAQLRQEYQNAAQFARHKIVSSN